ncbi:MAG: glycosyl transferase, partial [Bacteroidetes bacterium]|nr:glycosyl transferase [Bacteroidota bacterium]
MLCHIMMMRCPPLIVTRHYKYFPLKILVLRFSSIGDIVLCSPVLRAVKTQVDHVSLHVATKEPFAPLLSHSPHVEKTHLLKSSLKELIQALRAEKFDLILDLHHNTRTALIKTSLATVPARAFSKLNLRKWLYVNIHKDWMGQQHIVERYLETAAPLGVVNDYLGLEMPLGPDADQVLQRLPAPFHQQYDVLVLGARQGTKKPIPELLETICRQNPRPLVLVGGPEDRELGAYLAGLRGDQVWNAAGKASLQESAALLRA